MTKNSKTPRIILFSAPVGTGKTTGVQRWAEGKSVCGILNPIVNGYRLLLDLHTGQKYPFEAVRPIDNPVNLVAVGNYFFYKGAFEKAREILKECRKNPQRWVVLDEIGLLELEGKGLEPEAGKLIQHFKKTDGPETLIIIVRENLLEPCRKHYGLEKFPAEGFSFFKA